MENIFDADIIDAFRPTLENAKKITIIGHKNADGDCLGSTLALSAFFENKGVEAKIIIPNEIPEFYSWLDGIDKILIYNQLPWEAVDFVSTSDVIFMTDFNSFKRIDDLADSVQVASALKIVIDHHKEPEDIADFMFVDDTSSSASELVYEFLKILDVKGIDKRVAEYIFMGVVSDTGSFKYDSANSKTFAIASELLGYDIDKSKIIRGLYASFSYHRLRLLGFALNERTVYLGDAQVAYMYLSNTDKEKYSYKQGDHEDFVNFPLSISGVNISVLFIETDDVIRVSLRSRGDYDVNKVARELYNGGGHKNAAGGKSYLSLKETVDFFEKNIEKIIKISLSR